jgi:hypothetical protein
VNCAGATGDIEIQFYYMNPSGSDSLKVLVSTDGGGSFNQIGGYAQSPNWSYQTLTFPSTSPQTVVRFQGKSDGVSTGTDIGIDAVQILPPCAGLPNPGIISFAKPCSGETFGLSLSGGAPAAGLVYQWESSDDSTGPWTAVPGGTLPILSTAITDTAYFRVVVKCTSTGDSATSPVREIPTAEFYYCYCTSNATNASGSDIGKFTVQTIPGNYPAFTNGTATPLTANPASNNVYNNYTNLGPIVTYLDSSVRFVVNQISSISFQSATVAVFVDTNQNGVYDISEKIFEDQTSTFSSPAQQVSDTFSVPTAARVGITGLRVVMVQGSGPVDACGSYLFGETEDYLIDIQYHPCNGSADPGTALISDTTGCVGYSIIVTDTTHAKESSNIQWVWQYSPDGNSWSQLPNSQLKDTISYLVTGDTYFRLEMICYKPTATDTTYSNTVSIKIASPYACYCYSIAAIGSYLDSTDNGSFKIGPYDITTGGPHLNNPQATAARTDYTDQSNFDLWVDTTYHVEAFQTIRRGFHADAKYTLFMDLNNDFQYSAVERMWTGYTTASTFYVSANITIPQSVIVNLRTGMRLIVNNNTGPNTQSDDGCGEFTSGETEDYVVTFRSLATSITGLPGKLHSFDVYPNPSKGLFNVDLHNSESVGEAAIVVRNVMGQKVAQAQYRDIGTNYGTQIDLTGQPGGIYFIEVSAGGEKLVRKIVIN